MAGICYQVIENNKDNVNQQNGIYFYLASIHTSKLGFKLKKRQTNEELRAI